MPGGPRLSPVAKGTPVTTKTKSSLCSQPGRPEMERSMSSARASFRYWARADRGVTRIVPH